MAERHGVVVVDDVEEFVEDSFVEMSAGEEFVELVEEDDRLLHLSYFIPRLGVDFVKDVSDARSYDSLLDKAVAVDHAEVHSEEFCEHLWSEGLSHSRGSVSEEVGFGDVLLLAVYPQVVEVEAKREFLGVSFLTDEVVVEHAGDFQRIDEVACHFEEWDAGAADDSSDVIK